MTVELQVAVNHMLTAVAVSDFVGKWGWGGVGRGGVNLRIVDVNHMHTAVTVSDFVGCKGVGGYPG